MCGDIYICLYDADVGSKDVRFSCATRVDKFRHVLHTADTLRGYCVQDKMCSLWFNTCFIEPGKGWLLPKSQVDKACKDKKHFDTDFKLELFFE